eukprot:scaffold4428_cov112-Isochrysis_galbana.AAC.3
MVLQRSTSSGVRQRQRRHNPCPVASASDGRRSQVASCHLSPRSSPTGSLATRAASMDSRTSMTADAHCTLRVAGTSRRCEHGETVHSKTECPSMAAHSCGSSIVGADGGCRGGEIGALDGAGGRASHTSWRVSSAVTAWLATTHAVARRAQAETK